MKWGQWRRGEWRRRHCRHRNVPGPRILKIEWLCRGKSRRPLNLEKGKMTCDSHVNYWEERGGMGLGKKQTVEPMKQGRERIEVRHEQQWQFNCYHAMVVSDWTAKIISIKIQTELTLINEN